MTDLTPFFGSILSDAGIYHGEGPTYDPTTDTAWWFSISDCQLHELQLTAGRKTMHSLPFMASVLARVDEARQVVFSEHGLYMRDTASGALELITPVEADRPATRSNDGRMHPSGAMWCGTMTKTDEGRAGGGNIYHIARGVVTLLYPGISIPNGICFSPDGTTGYFVDTMENLYMKVSVDPATGLSTGKPEVFVDGRGEDGGIDGSVCAADGTIWNARWGVGEVHHYAVDGTLMARYKLPPKQTTCPAFIGRDADRLLVTTAREGLDDAGRTADPEAGFTYDLGIKVDSVFEADYKI